MKFLKFMFKKLYAIIGCTIILGYLYLNNFPQIFIPIRYNSIILSSLFYFSIFTLGALFHSSILKYHDEVFKKNLNEAMKNIDKERHNFL